MSVKSNLVTGYPNFVARQLIDRLLDSGERIFILRQDKHIEQARKEYRGKKDSVVLCTGDVINMHLGLSGDEVKQIRNDVEVVYHLAGTYHLASSEEEMHLINVEGTRNVVDFAAEIPNLKRFLHYSTAFVSGGREGVVLEDELTPPQRFRNTFEETKLRAEQYVRRHMDALPISVVRPSLIVGHSQTGLVDRFDGPYMFIYVLVNLPVDIPLPLVGKGQYPLNMVPVDYVTACMTTIANSPDAVGLTFHLVDLNPLPARRAFEVLAQLAHRKAPRGSIPTNLATALMKMPGLERAWRTPRLFVETMNQLVIYNAMNATEVCGDAGIICPPFPTYAPNLVEFMKKRGRKGL